MAIFLISQGVIQKLPFLPRRDNARGSEADAGHGTRRASQIAIKQLGTNGGGFFNVNSAHPFENPTAWSNLVEMVSILLIPAGLVYMYGRMVGSTRHGWVVLGVMMVWMLAGAVIANVAGSAETRLWRTRALRRVPATANLAATWKVRKSDSASVHLPFGRIRPPSPQTAP